MKTAEFDKLYLIQPEIYDRVLPYLNEIEKQELNDLNKKNRTFEENDETFEEKNEEQKNDYAEEINQGAEEMNHGAEEIDDDVIMDPHPENEEINIGSPDIPVEEPKVDKPKISVKMVKKSNGDWSIKKVKNFSCEICINKKFTTKRSLERHNKTFHVKKHSIKGVQVIPEAIYHPDVPDITSPETVKAEPETVKAEERKSKNIKRKFQYSPGEFHLVRDNQQFSRDEPVIKLPKGVVSKVPKRSKFKRKLNDDINGFEGKKFNWESYS